jgi:hypothetical protein
MAGTEEQKYACIILVRKHFETPTLKTEEMEKQHYDVN